MQRLVEWTLCDGLLISNGLFRILVECLDPHGSSSRGKGARAAAPRRNIANYHVLCIMLYIIMPHLPAICTFPDLMLQVQSGPKLSLTISPC